MLDLVVYATLAVGVVCVLVGFYALIKGLGSNHTTAVALPGGIKLEGSGAPVVFVVVGAGLVFTVFDWRSSIDARAAAEKSAELAETRQEAATSELVVFNKKLEDVQRAYATQANELSRLRTEAEPDRPVVTTRLPETTTRVVKLSVGGLKTGADVRLNGSGGSGTFEVLGLPTGTKIEAATLLSASRTMDSAVPGYVGYVSRISVVPDTHSIQLDGAFYDDGELEISVLVRAQRTPRTH